jgi:hypothetical protein
MLLKAFAIEKTKTLSEVFLFELDITFFHDLFPRG